MEPITVAKTGGDFASLTEALEHCRKQTIQNPTIAIQRGVYEEKIFTKLENLHLIGDNAGETILRFSDTARDIHTDGEELGTFRTESFYSGGSGFTAEGLTFQNGAGRGGQALALYVDGDRSVFRDCAFHGFQDTIFAGDPSRSKSSSYQKAKAPSGSDHGEPARILFDRCTISGDVDFIFGPACAVFFRCVIYSRDRPGYVTAPSTPQHQPYGFVFAECVFTGNAPEGSVYLGRPWRDYGQTVILRSFLDRHIHPAGWHNWNEPCREQTSRFAEFQNFGPGADTAGRVSWAAQLSPEEAEQYLPARVLAGPDQWKPL